MWHIELAGLVRAPHEERRAVGHDDDALGDAAGLGHNATAIKHVNIDPQLKVIPGRDCGAGRGGG